MNSVALAEVAEELGVGDHLLLGKGEELSGGREKPSILADALEAIIGAVYLAERAGGRHRPGARRPRGAGWPRRRPTAPTTRAGSRSCPPASSARRPRYEVDRQRPRPRQHVRRHRHDRGEAYGRGEGRSKKQAEQAAARRRGGSRWSTTHPDTRGRPTMAELPELETLRRELEKESVGKRVKTAEVTGTKVGQAHAARRCSQARLEGAKVKSVERRGPFLVANLDTGELLVLDLGDEGPPARRRAQGRRRRRAPWSLTFTQGGQLRAGRPERHRAGLRRDARRARRGGAGAGADRARPRRRAHLRGPRSPGAPGRAA